MSDISDLERRINAAFDRIGKGLERLDGAAAQSPAAENAPDQGELDSLRRALEEERSNSAQLEERLRTAREKASATGAQSEAALERLRDQLAATEAQNQRLRGVNDRLRSNNLKLRERNEQMVGDPHLINIAMLNELEALRVTREADVAEMDAILAEMKPLVGEA